jgi:hypothetical protein
MFDPTEFVIDCRYGYVVRHCRADYMRGAPLRERLNPLRYEVGIGRSRPCSIVLNKKAWMQRKFADALWRIRGASQ